MLVVVVVDVVGVYCVCVLKWWKWWLWEVLKRARRDDYNVCVIGVVRCVCVWWLLMRCWDCLIWWFELCVEMGLWFDWLCVRVRGWNRRREKSSSCRGSVCVWVLLCMMGWIGDWWCFVNFCEDGFVVCWGCRVWVFFGWCFCFDRRRRARRREFFVARSRMLFWWWRLVLCCMCLWFGILFFLCSVGWLWGICCGVWVFGYF